jgi:lipoyl(octanoyl) transferase
MIKTDFRWLGTVDYQQAYQQQIECKNLVKNSDQLIVLGLEHPTVLTLGRRSSPADFDFWKHSLVTTDRGGLATIHSPGQLVIYPIVDLKYLSLGPKQYVDLLLKSTQSFLKSSFDIPSEIRCSSGLFTRNGKIAFVGLRIQDHVSTHGISINVQNDLNLFGGVAACGVLNQPMDSIKSITKRNFDLKELYLNWVRVFAIELEKINTQ